MTSRKTRSAAIDALQAIAITLLQKRREELTNFTILTTRLVQAPVVTQRLGTGRFLAETTVQFQVIPKG